MAPTIDSSVSCKYINPREARGVHHGGRHPTSNENHKGPIASPQTEGTEGTKEHPLRRRRRRRRIIFKAPSFPPREEKRTVAVVKRSRGGGRE